VTVVRSRRRSLQTKIIAWSFVPTVIILVAVTVVVFYAYQDVAEDLVLERNRELAVFQAGDLAGELEEFTDRLDTVARTASTSEDGSVVGREALQGASRRLSIFDGGVLVMDTFGTVVASYPERFEILGQDWSSRPYYREMLGSAASGLPQAVFSGILNDGPDGVPVLVVAVPVTGEWGEFKGLLAGMFRLGATSVSSFYADIVKLRLGESGNAYLVDNRGAVIYHSDPERIGDDLSEHPIVKQMLGGAVGSVHTRDLGGEEIVASFAPVPGTPWGLVTEENWTEVTQSSRGYQSFLLLLLGLGVAVPVLVAAIGVRRITRPVTDLIEAAQRVAGGDFDQIITAQTGDEIEELAKQFNLMSGKLQESYAHLQNTIANRTRELSVINAIAAVVSQSLDLDEILNDAVEKTIQVMGIDAGGIYLLDEASGRLSIAAQRGFSPQFVTAVDGLELGEGFSGRVAQSGQPLVVRDIATDPRLTRAAARDERLTSVAIVPLSSRGRVLGTLFAASRVYREFSDQDVQLLTSVGHQIGIAVENARLFGQAEQRLKELEALYHADEEMYRHLHLDQVLQALVDVAVDILKADKSAVLTWEKGQQKWTMAVARGFSPDGMAALCFAPGEGITGQVAQSGEPAIVEDARMGTLRRGERREVVRTVLKEGIRSFMHLPIQVSGEVFGIFCVCFSEPHAFGQDEQRLFMALAQRAARAIENAQLFLAEQKRAEQFRVLGEVGQHITSIQPMNDLLGQMAHLIHRAFKYYVVAIGLIEGEELVFKVGAGVPWEDSTFRFEPRRLKIGQEGVTGWVAATGESLLVPDVSQEPRYVWLKGSATRSELAVPIKVKGKVIGVLDIESDQIEAFDGSDLLLLQSLANQAAIAMENARLFRAEQRRADQFRVISEVGRRITAILTVDELLEQMARLIREAFGYYGVGIGLIEGDEVVFKAGAGAFWDVAQLHRSLRLKVGDEGLGGWVAANGKPLLVPDVSQEPRFYYVPQVKDTRSEICVPLSAKGAVVGVLNAQSDRLNAFDQSDLVVLQALADQAAIAIETARLYEQAQQLAVMEERQRLARELHDAVTQTLFSASLIAEALPELWASDRNEGEQLLRELRQLNRGALAEMRTLLLELRPAALMESDLGDLLHQLGEAVAGRTGVPVSVSVNDRCTPPSEVHVALYRIAQEALNNVVKHAKASQVSISLHCTSNHADIDKEGRQRVELHVSDDGCGFVPDNTPPDRLGLGIIRERGHAIGATVQIESQPGQGTHVAVRWQGDKE
jgi:GAF domain-containing protein/HAMP domain-containing protein/anti-sigma regulatory factor (Ser/Thr protein kinase)